MQTVFLWVVSLALYLGSHNQRLYLVNQIPIAPILSQTVPLHDSFCGEKLIIQQNYSNSWTGNLGSFERVSSVFNFVCVFPSVRGLQGTPFDLGTYFLIFIFTFFISIFFNLMFVIIEMSIACDLSFRHFFSNNHDRNK